jgi:hypothetical protein
MNDGDHRAAANTVEQVLFETRWGSWLKSAVQVWAGRVVLSNRRLAFYDTGHTALGVLMVIMQFFAPQTRLVWEVPVESIHEVVKKRHGLATKYVVMCANGQEYTVQVGTGDAKWKDALTSQGIKVTG